MILYAISTLEKADGKPRMDWVPIWRTTDGCMRIERWSIL